jgi:thiol-disulfide isomerase/thioredoxin
VTARQHNEVNLDWLTVLVGPLVLLLLLALGVKGLPGAAVEPRPAPALPESGWLNTADDKPLPLADLGGKVVLVEFWTFGCYNCRNQLPYVQGWHEKYGDEGLVVIGVHTPEFAHERKRASVREALQELGISFPVVLDNDYAIWERYENHYWPAVHLIDHRGRIVYLAVGEGNYERTEERIQELLRQAKTAGD